MAGLSEDSSRAADCQLLLKQLEEEEERYAVPRKGSQSQAPRPQPRPRIPSLKEVEERKEGPNWTMSSPAQNLAAALNDPAVREYDLFTRTWGSYFVPNAPLPPSNIPNIELGDFLRYLKETAAGRKVHRSIVRQLRKESQDPTSTSPTSPLPPLLSQLQQDGRMYDLSSVPRLYMQADFSLEDPATFEQVLSPSQFMPQPRKKGKGKGAGPKADPGASSARQKSSKLLHEKLTHYLDIIEVHLAYQISQRSDLFFSTLTSQQELQSYIMTVRQDVVELRLRLHELDEHLTHRSLHLFQLCTQRHRNAQVLQKLKLIATVQQTQPTIQLLLSTSDFVGAIDLITTTQDVLQQELRGVHSLRHLGSQLAEMERAIEKMMEADLVHFAMEDITVRLKASSNSSMAAEISGSEEKLVSVVYGLLMQSKLHFLTALREGILSHLKTQAKEVLKAYLHMPELEGEGEDSPSLADCMRRMEFEDWLAMMDHLFSALLEQLRTVQNCVKVVASVCERAAGRKSRGGGRTSRQQSLEQTSTTAMIQETLKKNSTTDTLSEPPLPGHTNFQANTDLPLPPVPAHPTTSADSFEMSAAQLEAEHQLELLLLEDEMSDSRMGSVAPASSMAPPQSGSTPSLLSGKQPVGAPVQSSPSQVTGQVSSNGIATAHRGSVPESGLSGSGLPTGVGYKPVLLGQRSTTPGVSRGLEEMSAQSKLAHLGQRASQAYQVAATTAGQAEVAHHELTVDVQEKERLEDIMAVAHVNDNSQIISHAECQRLVTECHELLAASCDLVHSRCAKVLGIRAKAGLLENIVSSDFVSLVRLIEQFVRDCTEITGRQCPTLRSSLLSQAKRFLEHFHESRKSKVSLLLDGERWRQADVPAEIQSLVCRLESGIPPLPGGRRAATPDLAQSGQPPNKFLMVHNQTFAVLGIVPLLVKIVMEYCQCADDLPNLVSEVMSKLIETLKFFNGRTCMLVLGAGAVETVGLKTITARHLALVLRCLQAIQLLIPDIQRHFQWRLPPRQHVLLIHFEQVSEDYSRHCKEINSKIMSIMDDMISRHLSKWEAKSPVPSASFKTLIKQVVKLHENLVDILPHAQLQSLFATIEEIFRSRLRNQLVRLGITNNGSTQHGIVNSELTYFKGALGSLENIDAFGSSLFDVWTVNR